ncbi:hypothetical protein [Streptomyces nigra]|uniref:hypothetical protein n=1 Tax=Streptomyces nigra TaxID=1827580 RepID=UPI0037F3258C
MSSGSASEKISGSTVVLVAGLIADFSAAALFLISPDVRKWLRDEYFLVSLTALLLFATVVTLANMVISHRAKLSELQREIGDLTSRLTSPTNHDIEMFRAINDHASPQTNFIIWLREGFLVTRAHSTGFQALERAIEFFEREPRGLDDQELHNAYQGFIAAGRDLVNKMSEHMWYEGEGLTRLEIPREWERTQPERLEQAMREISAAHDSFITAYDSFFVAAQHKGLSSALSAPSS